MKCSPTVPPASISKGRFWILVGGICVLQAGLVLLFGERYHKAPAGIAQPARFGLADAPMDGDRMFKTFFAIDPTVFPLPGSNGFSERAWLSMPAPSYDVTNQTEPPAWLALNTAHLGIDFPSLHTSKRGGRFGLSAPPIEASEPWPVFLSAEKFRSRSMFEIQGPLAGRQLNAPSVLPAQTNALLLSNTVVQIAVDSAGQVISARLLDRSGSVDADGYALVQARNLRFRPSPGPVPVWGNAVIEWQTLAPSNVTAAITSFTQ